MTRLLAVPKDLIGMLIGVAELLRFSRTEEYKSIKKIYAAAARFEGRK